MSTLLHIDASARVSRSLSRQLSQTFVDFYKKCSSHEVRVLRRDVGLNPPPAVTESWIGAVFTKSEERTAEQKATVALSDQLIEELAAADVIVMGTPMYNYGMPTALKGWVDQIVRVNKTFTFDLARGDFPLEPVLKGKTLVLLSSCGEFGFEPGGVREHMNHLETHIRAIKHYFGVDEMFHVQVEYQEFGDQRHQDSIARTHQETVALAERLAKK